jgi:hypothetical protein
VVDLLVGVSLLARHGEVQLQWVAPEVVALGSEEALRRRRRRRRRGRRRGGRRRIETREGLCSSAGRSQQVQS